LVTTETVKRAVVSELTPLGIHPIVLWIFQSGILLRQVQKN